MQQCVYNCSLSFLTATYDYLHPLPSLPIHRVVEFGSVNKMLPTNVAIVFGPTVMRAETDSIEMATLMPIQNGIVEIMVNEFESIFRK